MMRYETFTWSIFIAYDTFSRDLAAAWSLALIVLALAVVWGENMARNAGSGRYYRSRGGASRLAEPIPLGPWRWPALVYCSAVGLVSLGLPVGVLAYWTVRGVAAGEPLLLLWKAAANSVGVSGAGCRSHRGLRRAHRHAGGALSRPPSAGGWNGWASSDSPSPASSSPWAWSISAPTTPRGSTSRWPCWPWPT